MNISNSKIAISGANRGIGWALAQECARRGAELYLLNRTLNATQTQELSSLGAKKSELISVDLKNKIEIQNTIKVLNTQNIDILINNAGLLTGGLIEEQNIDEIYDLIQVNITALIHLTHGILPSMLRRKRGKIVNNASVSGIMNIPCASVYSASKSAVLAFHNCIRQELKGTGVSTLALVTQGVDTRMYNDIPKLYGKNLNLSFLQSITPEQYAKRVCDAIESDQEQLMPSGSERLYVHLARTAPSLFEFFISKNFKR